MSSTQTKRWLLDTALFTGFLACFFLDLTGLSVHQFLGIAGGIFAAYHLLYHWDWVNAVTHRFFGKTSTQARRFYIIDAVLLVGLFTIIGTGLVISTWLNLSLTNYAAWHTVHIIASIGTLLALLVKIGLHARWIVSGARKVFASPSANAGRAAPVAVSSGTSRRDFLRLAGVVGIASVFALTSSVQGLEASSGVQENSNATTSNTNSASTNQDSAGDASNTANSQGSSSACTALCQRGCSYPGHCRRYTDGNSNGRCDLGECQA
jgi:hypothetical protein